MILTLCEKKKHHESSGEELGLAVRGGGHRHQNFIFFAFHMSVKTAVMTDFMTSIQVVLCLWIINFEGCNDVMGNQYRLTLMSKRKIRHKARYSLQNVTRLNQQELDQ